VTSITRPAFKAERNQEAAVKAIQQKERATGILAEPAAGSAAFLSIFAAVLHHKAASGPANRTYSSF